MIRKLVLAMSLAMVVIGTLGVALKVERVEASETITIKADGSIVPDTAPISSDDNVTYTFTGNIYDAIVVERSNIIIDGNGYTLEGSGTGYLFGFNIYESNNVTIKRTNIKAFENYGIYFYFSSYCSLFRNNITNNSGCGVFLYGSSYNTISGNNITNNVGCAITFGSSSYNTISANNMANNGQYGVTIYHSDNNIIYHNNFINNTIQAHVSESSNNVWDDGYPSGGNFWDDYGELDTDPPDGIGDTPYVIDDYNQDGYPLVVPVGPIPIVWDETIYPVELDSNSTISRFQFNMSQKMISFNVTGPDGTLGFCNLTIPNSLVQDLWQGNYTVLVDGEKPIMMNNWTDGTYTYIYFTYQHSTHKVEIIPEFPTWASILLILIVLTVAIAIYKRRLLKTPIHKTAIFHPFF